MSNREDSKNFIFWEGLKKLQRTILQKENFVNKEYQHVQYTYKEKENYTSKYKIGIIQEMFNTSFSLQNYLKEFTIQINLFRNKKGIKPWFLRILIYKYK